MSKSELLVTLDVTSLYTNIPHEEGIAACETILNQRTTKSPPTEDLCHLTEIILKRNTFSFNGDVYLQKHGTAMGTRMAPSYANLFMGALERKILSTQSYKPIVWLRYIDDIFAIWTHGQQLLENFLSNINKHHHTIKFTATFSQQQVIFLDTRVYIKEGHLETDLHVKNTDTHQYLHATSCHPLHCKTAIPFSQALRLKRICSNNEHFEERTGELVKHLAARGYDTKSSERDVQRAHNINRKDCLQPKPKRKTDRIPLVLTYNPSLPPIGHIMREHHHILHTSERMERATPQPPLIAFRRPKNLRDLLVRAELTQHQPLSPPGNKVWKPKV